MAVKDGFRIKEKTTNSGTGTIQLLGAVTASYDTAISEIGAGNTMEYWLYDANGIDWEFGAGGIVAGTPPTMTRGGVLRSSNSNNPLNLTVPISGAYHVVINGPYPGKPSGGYSIGENDNVTGIVPKLLTTLHLGVGYYATMTANMGTNTLTNVATLTAKVNGGGATLATLTNTGVPALVTGTGFTLSADTWVDFFLVADTVAATAIILGFEVK